MSNQKIVQTYLDRHGIGKLFEEMMAKLIKEMPNEPIVYLLKFLQRVHKRAEVVNGPHTCVKCILKRYKSSVLFDGESSGKILSPPLSLGMGLVGSSIPKKHTSDPQVVLPGSKPVVSSWSKGDAESVASDESHATRDRNYEKPWLANMKPVKGNKKQTGKNSPRQGRQSAQSFNDLFEDSKSTKKDQLSKSLPIMKDEAEEKKKASNWSSTEQFNKENTPPERTMLAQRIAPNEDDELQLKDVNSNTTTKKFKVSPSEYSKMKRHSSKKKAIQQKQKLQALLSNEDSKSPAEKEPNIESTDDEGIDVLENDQDLASEGVQTKSSGVKRTLHKSQCPKDDVTVGVCSRCAKLMSGITLSPKHCTEDGSSDEPFFNPSKRSSINKRISDDEDEDDDDDDDEIESVSQIDTSKPFQPKWPVLSDSEEDVEDRKNKRNSLKIMKNVNFQTSSVDGEKSDFFERNSPLRKKTKSLGKTFLSDNESEATFVNSTKSSPRHEVKSPSKQLQSKHRKQDKSVWKQQTASDEEDEQLSSTKIKGFKLKEALTDDASDVM